MLRAVRSIVAPVLMLAVVPGCGTAQKEFEGAVTMNMNMGGMMSVDVVTLSKGNKVRQEMSMMGQDMISIIDGDAGTGLMLMPAMQSYMKMDFKALASQASQAGSVGTPMITPTGTTETVLGHTCENYTVTMPNGAMQNGTMQMCVAKDLGFYSGSLNASGGTGGNPSMQAYTEVFRKTFPDGFFPLKMTVGAEGMSMTMTVTKIEPKSVSDDQFKQEVPAGYTEMKMPVRGGTGGGSQ
jgi:hypothetical protein